MHSTTANTISMKSPQPTSERPSIKSRIAANSLTPSTPAKPVVTVPSRLVYKAPQATYDIGKARQRRRQPKDSMSLSAHSAVSGHQPRQHPYSSNFNASESSINYHHHHEDLPEAPFLWNTDEELRNSPHQSLKRRNFNFEDSVTDFYDDGDTSYSQPSSNVLPKGSKRKYVRFILNHWQTMVQVVVILGLAFVVFDGHHRVHKHKKTIQQYDEERSHILEQMMWIDKAAKKVHAKAKDLQDETREELQKDVQTARDEIQDLQLRIQRNARDRINRIFGGKPVQIALKLPKEGQQFVVALSEDAPHAVATILEQIDQALWDDLVLTQRDGHVQLAPSKTITNPILEFTEKSKGCHEVGSVSVEQLERDELHMLILRVNTMGGGEVLSEDSVCLGKVIKGLDYLSSWQD